MRPRRAIFFDVDGVLLDSLSLHLKICEDLSRQYGLGLSIPTPAQFKELARTGIRVSPMKDFFMAVGFGESDAERADAYYREHFMEEYAPSPFSHVAEVLSTLHKAGFVLGIVTANVRANVEKALGKSWELFDPRLCYTYDHVPSLTKPEALEAGAEQLGVAPEDVIFVGDQVTDRDAAQAAGVRFLGVTYGWGISLEDTGFETVQDRWELGVRLLQMAPPTDEQLKVGLEHGRGMYIYHADQRHRSLNFYFTLAAALSGGLGAIFTSEKIWVIAYPIAPFLASGFAVIVVAVMDFFARLDARNAELVECDKKLLECVEAELGKRSGLSEEFRIIRRGNKFAEKNRCGTYKHLVPVILRVFKIAALIALVTSWAYWTWVQQHSTH